MSNFISQTDSFQRAKACIFSTVAMMALFSQYLANFYAPVPSFKTERGWHFGRIRVFNLFPVSVIRLTFERNSNKEPF